jgi:RNA polymerase sigma-70 factor (ECF subfamily)
MAPAVPDQQLCELMRAAQAGDGAAYIRLLELITPRIRQIATRRLGFAGREIVEDLVQDVLLSVHTVRATYDPSRPFTPWLLAILRNRLVDGARRYARQAAHELLVEDLDVTFAEARTNIQEPEYGDPEALDRAIETLPSGQREAIVLLKLKELSLKEAAAVSGSSIAALKVATHRAMATLRRKLSAPASGSRATAHGARDDDGN